MTGPIVVKLGGSFAGSAARAAWLRAIGKAGGRAVLVPGGGPFADTVRAQQAALGLSDRAAHRMALLAMAQYGLALADFAPIFAPADSAEAIREGLAAARVPVWLPWPMLLGAPDIAESWDVTSDSLALWLARELSAPSLLLIKQARGGLALLDAAFATLLPRYAGRVVVAGPDDAPLFDALAPPGQELRRDGG